MSSEENQFNVQGYNIVTMLKRLEAATSRLEDISIFQNEASKNANPQQKSINPQQQAGQETGGAGRGIEPAEKAKSVTEFNVFIEKSVIPFVETSTSIDPLVGQSADILAQEFNAQLEFLDIVSKSKKPEFSDPSFLQLLKPMNERIEKINEIKDSNRSSNFFNHLNTISEGAPVLGWIMGETPVSMIPEFKDSAQFWSNRVIKEYKEKDPSHVAWVNQFLGIFEDLKLYVKQYHATGPSWNNAKGKLLSTVLAERDSGSASAPTRSPAGGAAPPPPPPPPPASIFDGDNTAAASSSTSGAGMNAVFADLNRGENITSGLKKVDKSEMTHKNPELRQVTPSKKPTPPKKPSNLSSNQAPAETRKPAKMELVDGSKWIVENFTETDVNPNQPIVIEAEMHQSVFIGRCSGITVQVKGKANAISVSETRNTGIVVDSLISGIDIIKSFKFGLQIVGSVAMISVDKSDEGSIYLSEESIAANVQVFTSCATALNVNVMKNDDYEELPIPEQFKHSVKNGRLVSEIVEHAG